MNVRYGVELSQTAHDSLSRETVRRRLAENDLNPGARTCGVFRRSMLAPQML